MIHLMKKFYPKIPAGTKAGTEIKFNCVITGSIYNDIITLSIEEVFQKEGFPISFLENMKWKADGNNNKIEYVSKFVVNPSYSTSKNLEKNGKIYLNVALIKDITDEISIIDGTFILEKEKENSIKLISCDSIPKNTKKGEIKITCLVEEETKDGSFYLKLGEGKKIDNTEPLVSGNIIFSQDGPIQGKDDSSSTQINSSNNFKILKTFLTIFIFVLF